jgi:hypothetical protein
MTLPDERYRAVKYAREFLYDLTNPSKTPGVPKAIRQRASGVLRHFPDEYHMNQAAEHLPDCFQQTMEPVTRMFAAYEQSKVNKSS